jgi:hypothetical protein
MSELQEWTPKYVSSLFVDAGWAGVAKKQNAVVAAVTKQCDDFRRALEQRIGELDELREQLK